MNAKWASLGVVRGSRGETLGVNYLMNTINMV